MSKSYSDVVLIAHRGKGPTSKLTALEGLGLPDDLPPENSLEAFRAGIREGADGIEMDIFLSKDGVPMVIHDDELNRNVAGAKRAAQTPSADGYLGKVSEHNAEELKKFDLGGGAKIPTLQEVIELVAAENASRKSTGKKNIILNIEFKDKTSGSVDSAVAVVDKAVREELISKQDVIYCSFDHGALEEVVKISEGAQVAPALKTAFLFGEDKVDIEHGWIVPPDTKYRPGAIDDLEKTVRQINQHKGVVVAVDAVLWDIDEPLIAFAETNKLGIHASTSDFRDFKNVVFIANLAEMRKRVSVCFKTDEPAKISSILARAYDAERLDLSRTIIEKVTPVTNKPTVSAPDLSSVKVTSVESIGRIKRLPKPGQAIPKGHIEYILQDVGPNLKKFAEGTEDRGRDFMETKEAASAEASVKEALGTSITSSNMRKSLEAASKKDRKAAYLDSNAAYIANRKKGNSSSISF